MRNMDEFGSYSGWQDRAPWELTPAQARQERHSCRQVEELGFGSAERCKVVEQGKERRAQANAKRAAEQARRQAQQTARREAAHRAAAEAVRRSTPERPVEAKRPAQQAPIPPEKQPPAAGTAARPKKKNPLGWVLLFFACCFAVNAAVGWLRSADFELDVDSWTEGDYSEEDGDEDDFFYRFWNEEVDGEEETYSLPSYEGDSSGLSVALQSAVGKRALSYQELYEKCRPSMVSITVTAGRSGATGSGIILTEDGYILTCHHVVEDAEYCYVVTSDDQSYEATLVGSDAQTDLAVLKIDAEGLVPAELGDSDELRIGDEALAIGDPLGESFRATLTNGIISGINRSVTSNGYSMTLIQTTAAVNSGNSGGGLFNIYGQVVGVVNLKMVNGSSDEATVEGMGMAVPTVTVKSIVEVLASEGTVRRPVLGISCSSIDELTAGMTGIPTGLLIQSIDPLSDCGAQGLQVYDLITEVNGIPLCTVEEFKEITADCEIGDTVILTVYRDNNLDLDQEDGETEEDYDYQYFGEVEVALMDSTLVS